MAIQKITADVISSDAITTASISDSAITAAKLAGTLDLTGKTITVATASSGDNDTSIASTAFVQQEIASLVDSAPGTLNTLNELAAALGDDANFSTTVTNSIALKAPLASPTFTGNAVFDTSTLVVDATNDRVGIGTTSPQTELEISAAQSPFLRLTSEKDGNHDAGDVYGELQFFTQESYGNAPVVSAKIQSLHTRAGTGHSNADAGLAFFTSTATNDATATERMRIESATGNVGIGTTSPQAPLHARNGSSGVSSYTAGTRAIIEGTATTYLTIAAPATSLSGILFADPDDSDNGYVTYNHSTGGDMDFGTAGSTRLRIDSSGYVGIGETSPENILHIKKNASGSSYSADGGDLVIIENNSSAGIDLRTPTGDAGAIYFSDTTRARGAIIYYHSLDDMYFNVAGTSGAMVIDSSGKVLIGDTASHTDDLLQIETPASGGGHGIQIRRNDSNSDQGIGRIMFGNNTDTDLASIYVKTDGSTDNAAMTFNTQPNGGALTERMRVTSGGDISVGSNHGGFSGWRVMNLRGQSTGALYNFEASDGTRRAAIANSGTDLRLQTFTGGNITFEPGTGSEKMRVFSNGRVKIGTSFSGCNAGLHVANADIRCTGAAIANDANSISMSQESSGGVITARGPSTSQRGTITLSVNRSNGGGAIAGLNIEDDGGLFAFGIGYASASSDVNYNASTGEIFVVSSSRRYKSNITDLNIDTSKILSLRPVSYTDNETETNAVGLIAEEVHEEIPQLVNYKEIEGYDEIQPDSVKYSTLSVYLLKAIQEQQTIIDDLKSRIETLEG